MQWCFAIIYEQWDFCVFIFCYQHDDKNDKNKIPRDNLLHLISIIKIFVVLELKVIQNITDWGGMCCWLKWLSGEMSNSKYFPNPCNVFTSQLLTSYFSRAVQFGIFLTILMMLRHRNFGLAYIASKDH